MVGRLETAALSILGQSLKQSSRAISNIMRAFACSAIVVGSAATLVYGTGADTADRSLRGGLASLRSAWTITSPTARIAQSVDQASASPVAWRANGQSAVRPISGDEGFWLSSHALAGSVSNTVRVGDAMSLADHNYVVTELKPIAGAASEASEDKALPALTLVIAREVMANDVANAAPEHAPRVLRFLIEAAPAGTVAGLHRAL